MDEQPTNHHAYPQPEQPVVPEPRPRRRRRLVAGAAAAALAVGVGGVGAGYAVGRGVAPTSSTSASGPTTTTPNSSDGTVTPGDGFGHWQQGLQDQPDQQQQQGQQPQLPTDPFGSGGSQSQSSTSTQKAAGAQLTGLVRIVSTMKYNDAKAAGTGMVLTSGGEVVTNHHVVEGATSVKVKVMTTGKTYTARVVGTDAKDDVAVLQLDGASGLATVTPDTDGVSTGDKVTAVGDGGGTVNYLSAADGSIIATGRQITTQNEGTATGETLKGMIEISSDVISGFSGGATYDADGQVVGMTTAASSGSDPVGYAVPIAKVTQIVDDLENGVVKARYDYGYPAFLGVALSKGTTVQGVYAGTPAAQAGLSAGDRITAVGGIKVSTATQLRAAVASHSPGDSVSVTWTATDGASHSTTLTLVTGPVA